MHIDVYKTCIWMCTSLHRGVYKPAYGCVQTYIWVCTGVHVVGLAHGCVQVCGCGHVGVYVQSKSYLYIAFFAILN